MPSNPRFSHPVSSTRPFGSHRYDVFSPKLARGVTVFGRQALSIWTTLEASPSITAYCERPIKLPHAGSRRAIDFWVRDAEGEQFLVIRRDSDRKRDEVLEVDSIPVRYLEAGELELHQVALTNWGRVIRDLSAFSRLVPNSLPAEVAVAVGRGMTIKDLQLHFAEQAPDLVQLAIFKLLHSGKARCPSLSDKEFSTSLVIEVPCPALPT
ncbi:hypothetical protein ABT364_05670 [Massilia sp. SR12]